MPSNITVTLLLAGSVFAADFASIPADPIGKKKELLFSDDFEGTQPAKVWHSVVPTFVVENGSLKGSQTRDADIPAADGKPGVRKHAAVHGLDIPTKDSVVEVKIRFGGNSMMSVEFDDRNYTGSHYGHICLAQVRPNGVTIVDQRDGGDRNDIREMAKDPSKKEERAKLLVGRSANFPLNLETEKWYNLRVETVRDAMRVCIDEKPVAFLKSSGIGHETKSKLEFGVGGKDGFYDELKVWNAEPAQ